ncbi:synaptophysin-like isoform X1 [Artemia franciscana]|uniref:MARVEL domain-containing protein n=1 Tax=Artemia franciscana TaxID=6661 RepID=A0AA88IBE4_ARTSF|nr:hypothetical protein QYM36_003413 [Artemia franciscana]
MELDLDILKIPRGFIRILQFVFAVFAFACLTSFSTVIEFMVKCKDNGSETVHPVSIVYPFRLDHIHTAQACKDAFTYDYSGDFSSDAQFFVATGVLSMLYALGSLAFYLMCDDVYTNNKIYPLIDFIVCTVLAVFWLSGSSAWANGLQGLKYTSNPDNWLPKVPYCKENECATVFHGNFASLDISVLLGFLNFFLWASNLWFVYKETAWFQPRAPPPGVTIQTPVA